MPTVLPQGQSISDTAIGDETSPDDFYYWGQLYGQYYFTPSLASGQEVNAKIYISPTYPSQGNSQIGVGTKVAGTIWAMYTTPGNPNQLAQIATFSAVAVTS
ncbi:MAG: hypothetical protein KGH64_01760 [Candidatus Micrarchaeota archaeon]|nr:hypothetical protein [Candidatus Micrarchaeota archaeon]MDE1859133.1 hypothetical protein [Candidatus Micrarchaeota archaeon]